MATNEGFDDALYGETPRFDAASSLPQTYLVNEDTSEVVEVGEQGWEDTWLHSKYRQRVAQGRDLVIVVIGENASTGTGKTTLAVQLGINMDASDAGLTEEKATLSVEELMELYLGVESRSCLVGDEAQGMADARRSNSNENVFLSQAMAMARFREVYLVLTLPSADMLDKRLKKRADVLIVASEQVKGEGRVYELFGDDLNGGDVRTRYKETISWGPLDGDPRYQKLAEDKEEEFEELIDEFRSKTGGGEGDDEPSEREVITSLAREQTVDLHERGYSFSEIQNELPASPHGESDEWSRSTLSDWLSDVEKGSALDDD